MLYKDPYCIVKFIFKIKALFTEELDKMSRFNEPGTRCRDCRKQRKKKARSNEMAAIPLLPFFISLLFFMSLKIMEIEADSRSSERI